MIAELDEALQNANGINPRYILWSFVKRDGAELHEFMLWIMEHSNNYRAIRNINVITDHNDYDKYLYDRTIEELNRRKS